MKKIYSFLVVLFLLIGQQVSAQTEVMPPSYSNSFAGGTFLGPLSNSARTYQVLIHANQLTALVGTQLTGFSFRSTSGASATWPAADITFANYDVYLSESVLPANRSFTFADNVVGTQVQVRSGSLTITQNTYPFGNPTAFGPEISFNTPYVYTGGNLLVEIRHNGFTGTSKSVDAVLTSNPLYGNEVSACWESSYTATSTTSQGNVAAMQFSYTNSIATDIIVSTQGSVPATIVTDNGTLQMEAQVLPINASQAVTWSIVPGTGTAIISASGLVTALTNGNIWAKAVSQQTLTAMDSMEITITNQIIPVDSIQVRTQANVPSIINSNAGTLQMESEIFPNASNQAVTWSLIPGTGSGSVSPAGLVTAITNGNVWAKAISVQDPTMMDSLQITITNQILPVDSVVVSTLGNVPALININGGSLQMEAEVYPSTADQSVTWSIMPSTGNASISSGGLINALANGNVWAKAISVADPTKKDSMEVMISGQGLGIDDMMSSNGLKVFPVPVENGILYFEVDPGYFNAKADISLTTLTGSILRTSILKSGKGSVDVQGLAAGMYILCYSAEGKTISVKFLIK